MVNNYFAPPQAGNPNQQRQPGTVYTGVPGSDNYRTYPSPTAGGSANLGMTPQYSMMAQAMPGAPASANQHMNNMAAQYQQRYGAPDPNATIGPDGVVPRMQQPQQMQMQPYSPQATQQAPAQSSPNPYLGQQAQAITSQVTQNLQRNVLPGINSGAIASGGFGGSRQGIAQGMAIGDTNQGLSNSLAGLYGNAYEGDQNRSNQMQMQQAALANQSQIASMNDATQRMGLQNSYSLGLGNLGLGNKQADNSYNLGLGGLGLQNKSLDQGFYTNQRGQDLQQLGLGSQLMNQGNLGLQQGGQGLYGIGQQQMQNGLYPIQQYGQMLSPFTGLNQTQTQSTPGASSVGSALGGALTAAQIWQLLTGTKQP